MIEELTTGIRRWSAPHPEWRPRVPWAQEVACFAVTAGDDLVLVDPLAPRERLRRGLDAPPWSMRSG